jgi:hypothetical protein
VVPEWMKTHDFDELLAIAKQATAKGVRADLIRRAFLQNSEALIGKLPAIREVLDERAAVEFFWFTRNPSNELADAAAQAGFPDEAVRSLRENAKRAEEQRRSVADQLALPDRTSSKWAQATLEKLRQSQPELRDWVADFAERGLPADEVVARLQEAEPSLQGRDDETRRLVFHSLFAADAVEATHWLKESREDWRPLLQSAVGMRLPRAEELWRLSECLPDEDGKPMLLSSMGNAYWNWCSRDPEGFQKGFDALPAGARRDQLAATVVSMAGSRARESALELVQRIGDPVLRAEAEKRIKGAP